MCSAMPCYSFHSKYKEELDKCSNKHFDNGATSKFDDVLLEHGGLLHVLMSFLSLSNWIFFGGQVQGTILRCSSSLSFVVGPVLHV